MVRTQDAIQTTRFGVIYPTIDTTFRFVRPLLGFESLQHYCLIPHDAGVSSPFTWLQCLDVPDLAFVVIQPVRFSLPHTFQVTDDLLRDLGLSPAVAHEDDVTIYTTVFIPPEDPEEMTANLMAPLILCPSTHLAAQVVLQDSPYSTRTPLLPAAKKVGKC